MRKKNIWKVLAVSAMLLAGFAVTRQSVMSYAAVSENTPEAVPGTETVLINGTEVTFNTYSLNGNEYYRLRDIAKSFMGTSKSISITEDSVNHRLELKSNEYYTATGDELGTEPNTENAAVSKDNRSVIYDGSAAGISGYDINGEIYFTLNDLQSMMGFTLGTRSPERKI